MLLAFGSGACGCPYPLGVGGIACATAYGCGLEACAKGAPTIPGYAGKAPGVRWAGTGETGTGSVFSTRGVGAAAGSWGFASGLGAGGGSGSVTVRGV